MTCIILLLSLMNTPQSYEEYVQSMQQENARRQMIVRDTMQSYRESLENIEYWRNKDLYPRAKDVKRTLDIHGEGRVYYRELQTFSDAYDEWDRLIERTHLYYQSIINAHQPKVIRPQVQVVSWFDETEAFIRAFDVGEFVRLRVKDGTETRGYRFKVEEPRELTWERVDED